MDHESSNDDRAFALPICLSLFIVHYHDSVFVRSGLCFGPKCGNTPARSPSVKHKGISIDPLVVCSVLESFVDAQVVVNQAPLYSYY